MKREIKFRAKSIETGKLVYGHLVQTGDWPKGDESDEKLKNWWEITNGYTTQKIDRNTVGQYTGLLDKNGKEIYEGDIVKWSDKIYKIEWHDRMAGFVMQHNLIERPDIEFESEIIGNIYENPELIKK